MEAEFCVRDAVLGDLADLVGIKGAGTESLHLDRLRDARGGEFRYLVLQAGQKVIGQACLVFRRPAYWSDAADLEHLPQIVDLQILESQRGRGFGTAFIRALERIAAARSGMIYLAVEPLENPRAYALYRRLGYQSIQSAPYQKDWQFTDSAGKVHQGCSWVVDMFKDL